MNIVFFVSVL